MDVHSVSPRLLLWDNSSFLGPGPNEQPIERSQLADLAGAFGSRLRRRLLLGLYSLAKAGRLIDRWLGKIRVYRGLRWALKRAFPSSSVEHH